ncbi:hypothetical protein EHI8A_072410 [Entamoeba histolytica HM-1:IMSS-B]|uniref:Uncharacterized protein n=6 Tax=Entamoeba histolytica TaxID=5759 RepID=C4LW28_ENTH1|nr:hypothetical protein EHI_141810 [Entamoeba histolytica HM-1:IMSS]EMD45535.1 Hypothetical protein EHI5A_094700 [Entamoeba histolytica KU27]EMH76870.1 hypothetical protein EHI8A_072410 [Entamoeba histolytica HM-1:IMSS-B]EMS14852.1 hypothetical protein KM1_130060 [Entamoeba histolytica HM-3:IMSS]ENY60040.1 hypothetical protein EHI7A_006510 [Entamoeba histolytica HM-1:IMSS-A]GAT92899.1 hypothetical protein CL6EHI_141810 [Entamoeba histolytica]|eukprot:XP_654648.1 hypothetical protein EHI_141810 [Entamoeba histolytica HM-1:IMSS]
MDMIATGLDVLDRIEKIEKLRDEVQKIVDMNERVKQNNVYTIEEVIKYAKFISGTVAQQPPYPKMPSSLPYPYHIPVNVPTGVDLLENAGWNRDITAYSDSDESKEEQPKKEPEFEVDNDNDVVLMESSVSEEIL